MQQWGERRSIRVFPKQKNPRSKTMNILKSLFNTLFGSGDDTAQDLMRLAVRATSLYELEHMLQDWERRSVRAL